MTNTSPTEKQIAYADLIANTLNIDFPTGSPDFNWFAYQDFIECHLNEFLTMLNNTA